MKFGVKVISLFLLASQETSAFARSNGSFNFSKSVFALGRTRNSRSTAGGRQLQSSVVYDQKRSLASLASSVASRRAASGYQCAWLSTTPRGGSTSSSMSTALNSAVAATEESTAPVEIFRKDYKPLEHVVSKVNMDFVINDGKTTVTTELFIEANPNVAEMTNEPLVLDGDETCVKLLSLEMDGKPLQEGEDYTLEPGKLLILNPKSGAKLTTVVEIIPEDNTQLSGLYKSGPMYCTQCEAMGFRRITYYPDRPDNMAIFESVRLEADKDDYPILLANGNMVDSGSLDGGRHYAVWTDPFPKPSYLFCCVAGNLGSIQDTYTTGSGREVKLEVFSEKENVGKLSYAMESLKRSMKWDEDRYGLEYDLDLYNIVAVDSFNMGAMENKGLNVFNTAYVLADKETATDTDFERVEGVIGHEYFHNCKLDLFICMILWAKELFIFMFSNTVFIATSYTT
jgi:hypothetical protein